MYNHIRVPNDPDTSIGTNFWWDRLSHNIAARSRHEGACTRCSATGTS